MCFIIPLKCGFTQSTSFLTNGHKTTACDSTLAPIMITVYKYISCGLFTNKKMANTEQIFMIILRVTVSLNFSNPKNSQLILNASAIT